MDTEAFVQKSLNNPTNFFYHLLESTVNEYIGDIRAELKISNVLEEESELIEELATLLEKDKPISTSFFYDLLGMESIEEDRVKKIAILQDKLQTMLNRLEMEQKITQKNIEKLKNTLKFLKILKEKFLDKNIFFSNAIDDKIVLFEGYALSLEIKRVNFLERKKIYKGLIWNF